MTASGSPGGGAPLVLLTQFKSGTWLTRAIIEAQTGLTMAEPDYGHGTGLDYEDPSHIFDPGPGRYYSWHAVPVPAVQAKLRAMNARVILQIRNIYDLCISQYYHFANNIDWEFNRGAGKNEFFGSVSREAGLAALIAGYDGERFTDQGFGMFLRQIALMIEFSQAYPCCLLTFESLVEDRAGAAARIADYLNVDLDEESREAIARRTHFETMRAEAAAKGTQSHFRKGRLFAHGDDLTDRLVSMMHLEMARHTPHLPDLVARAGVPEILTLRMPEGSAWAADAEACA